MKGLILGDRSRAELEGQMADYGEHAAGKAESVLQPVRVGLADNIATEPLRP